MSRAGGMRSILAVGCGLLFCGGTIWLKAGDAALVISSRASAAWRIKELLGRKAGKAPCLHRFARHMQRGPSHRSSVRLGPLSKEMALSAVVHSQRIGAVHDLTTINWRAASRRRLRF